MNYFKNMINILEQNLENNNIIINNIITPFTGYYISNYYIGNEIISYNLPNTTSINLLNNDCDDIIIEKLNKINNNDIIYVQYNFFDIFINILKNINKKIILLTGQWQLPKLLKSDKTDDLLNNDKILLWFSQNPIYDNKKYFPFPYGINYGYELDNPSIRIYSKYLVNNYKNNFDKNIIISNLPMNYITNICRNVFVQLNYIDYETFCNKLIKSKFILSPIGDRDDCYRHWEAIGFDTMPISNVGNLYKPLFNDNMYYVDNTLEMLKIFDNQDHYNNLYKNVNKDLITVEYWKDFIINHIKSITSIKLIEKNIMYQKEYKEYRYFYIISDKILYF